jgi:predicted CXXCH cytochrome family protein
MRLPLGDAECRPCHTPVLRRPGGTSVEATTFAAEAETEGRAGTSYHAIREHDAVRVGCVACHGVHTTDSDAASRFISKTAVVPICRECHTEM